METDRGLDHDHHQRTVGHAEQLAHPRDAEFGPRELLGVGPREGEVEQLEPTRRGDLTVDHGQHQRDLRSHVVDRVGDLEDPIPGVQVIGETGLVVRHLPDGDDLAHVALAHLEGLAFQADPGATRLLLRDCRSQLVDVGGGAGLVEVGGQDVGVEVDPLRNRKRDRVVHQQLTSNGVGRSRAGNPSVARLNPGLERGVGSIIMRN